MIKKILGCLVVLATFIISCKEDDGRIVNTFSAQVEATNSSIAPLFIPTSSLISEKYKIIVVFSTDGGATYVDYPVLKPGDAYKAKVIYRAAAGEQELGDDACFRYDWTNSVPAPTGATTGNVADFVMEDNNALSVTVTDYSAYNASTWTGSWVGYESGRDGGGHETNILTADPGDANKVFMDNVWGNHDAAYMVFQPSTNIIDQLVVVPDQTTSDGNTISGTGSYDQCRQTVHLDLVYMADGDGNGSIDEIKFSYDFVKP